jgi:hypothetical protein
MKHDVNRTSSDSQHASSVMKERKNDLLVKEHKNSLTIPVKNLLVYYGVLSLSYAYIR